MGQFGVRQITVAIHLLGRGWREGRINLHVAVAAGLDEGLCVQEVGLDFNLVVIFRHLAFILQTRFIGMQENPSLPRLGRSFGEKADLGNLLHIAGIAAHLDGAGQLQHHFLPHPVGQVIGPARNEDGR